MLFVKKLTYIFIFLFFFNNLSLSHVQHYSELNSITFEIYRNNKHIGEHSFTFINYSDKNELLVTSKINFKIKKLGVVLYKYFAEGTEVFKDGQLVKFNSKTDQNGKLKYVNLELKDKNLIIDGSSFKGKTDPKNQLGTWWNHSLVEAPAQISAVSGRIIHQKVDFLGKETIKINNITYKTLHFKFTSTDKKMKENKKLNTDVWYDEKTLNWVKASFDKKGKWEYRLLSIK
jgi:hypothetical protein